MTRIAVLLIVLAFTLVAGQPPVPVLIELFTSEGCSTCPPTDLWAQKLESTQPVPNVQLIVLSEHVDYWDHEGWKDPYSLAALTLRQHGYSVMMRLGDVYTPQMIVDGVTVMGGRDANKNAQILVQAAAPPKEPVRIVSASVEHSTPPVLHARIEADAAAGLPDGDVMVAVALDHAESQVLRGENKDRHLTHTGVVEALTKIGKVEKGRNFQQDFQYKLKPGADPSNLRIVAFVQSKNQGRVLGVALEKAPFK